MTEAVQPKKIIKLYSALDNYGGYPFINIDEITSFVPAYSPDDLGEKDGCLVIWGGADINPAIYGHKPTKQTTWWSDSRDNLEVALAKAAIKKNIPIIGVCRGAQLMCALSGGTLIQHVTGHGRSHAIETEDGQQLITSSLHHQMMFPWNTNHRLVAWSLRPQSECYISFGRNEEEKWEGDVDLKGNEVFPNPPCEPEIVVFPDTKTLAIQGHPEFMDHKAPFVTYCNDLIKKELIEKYL